MGLSSKQSKTKVSSATTPTVPAMFAQPTATLAGRISSMTDQAPQATPPSALQQRTFQLADGLAWDPTLEAQGGTRSLMDYHPGTLAGTDLSAYTNPWESAVTDATLGDLERFRAMGINQNSSSATLGAGRGGLGGSRVGIADAATNEAAMRTAASQAAALRQAGFINAQDRATADLDRGFQGAQFRGSMAGQLGEQALAGAGSRRADLGLMGDLGTQQHALDQEQNPQNVQMQYIANLARLLQGLNPGLYTGSNTNTTTRTTDTQSLMDSISQALKIGSSLGIPGMPKI